MQRFCLPSLNTCLIEDKKLKIRLEKKLFQIEANLNMQINYKMPFLHTGLCGIILFYAYLYKFTGCDTYFKKMNALINKSVEVLENIEINIEFSQGITGIAWCIQHLINEKLIESEYAESMIDFDNLILSSVTEDIRLKRYDFFSGLIGKGVYFLERYKLDKSVKKHLIFATTELLKLKEKKSNVTFWQDYHGFKRNNSGDEAITLGMAHGISSILVFLL